MAFERASLPYDPEALSPFLSREAMKLHYEKHHAGYVEKLNLLTKESLFEGMKIEEVIFRSFQDSDRIQIFNNAAQAWNHEFYWQCLSPRGGGDPKGESRLLIENSFGSYEKFRDIFKEMSLSLFGSGWIWMVHDQGKARLLKGNNAYTPLTDRLYPLLTLDVWEHAYYLDYQNRRNDFIETFLSSLINWEFVNVRIRSLSSSNPS